MKPIRVEAIGVLALMFAAIAGCEYLPFMATKPPAKVAVSRPTPTPSATPTPTPTATPEVKKHRHHKHLHTPTPATSPTPMAESSPATVITTGEFVQRRSEIAGTIKRVEGRLSAIKRSALDSQDAADYDQIKAFIAAARSALQEQDDLRAHSLAEKAARLAAQLSGRVSSP
ncbi:MAG: hypothetical protein ACLQU2_31270 [Candidatus Binataceae bacterium]